MLDQARLRKLLEPFGLDLSPSQTAQTLAYHDLLLRWNQKINLTAIRDPEECVTRHFGESLLISRYIHVRGDLIDIGSGAGFPGLALKIVFPDIAVTLLEPVAKKRAFLKEATRVCGFSRVEVLGDRLEDFVRSRPNLVFHFATMRAVGNLGALVPLAAQLLELNGELLLWLTQDQIAALADIRCGLTWGDSLPIPHSRTGVILRGTRLSSNARFGKEVAS